MAQAHAVRNPRTGESDYSVQYADRAQIEAITANLRAAQPAWAALGLAGRAEVLGEFAKALEEAQDELIEALSRDTGRYRESVMEAAMLPGFVRRWCEQAGVLLGTSEPRPSATPPIRIHTDQVPYCVVGVISPWNFPLLLSLIDTIPALAAGCSVLIKPSEVTPRFVEPLKKAIARNEQLQSVLQIAVGDGEAGSSVCQCVDMICFTGSVRTGSKVSAIAGERMIPASLELGGKDAAVVFADADLSRAARAICWGGMTNAGQACQAIERVYVERSAFDTFVELLVEAVSKLELNDGDARTGHLGPIISAQQVDVIKRHLEDAHARGARCLMGGEILNRGGGLWCAPTVLVDVNHDMAVMNEETFAALLPVMPFDTEDEAVALANCTQFGLSGCVFSGDNERALRIARQLEAGAVSVNDSTLTAVINDAEKNSFKSSGLGGSRMGNASIKRFVRTRALLENPDDKATSPWWF